MVFEADSNAHLVYKNKCLRIAHFYYQDTEFYIKGKYKMKLFLTT